MTVIYCFMGTMVKLKRPDKYNDHLCISLLIKIIDAVSYRQSHISVMSTNKISNGDVLGTKHISRGSHRQKIPKKKDQCEHLECVGTV
jgi:hypothetical protein